MDSSAIGEPALFIIYKLGHDLSSVDCLGVSNEDMATDNLLLRNTTQQLNYLTLNRQSIKA